MSLINNKSFYKFMSIWMIICMLLALSGCGEKGAVYTLSKAMEIIAPESPEGKYHTSGSADFKSACKSGLYELFLDDTTKSVALKDTSGTVWYSLPGVANTEASLLSVEVTNGSKIYKLNSQDNSVAIGTAKAEITENGIVLSYILSEKKDSPKFKISMDLILTLEDGLLNASVNCKNAALENSDYKITKLSVLPYFGAVSAPAEDDFILIPDGPGALINLSTASDASYTLNTYGSDYAVESSNGHDALLAAFGLKNGGSAFAAIVTEGDAISEINAEVRQNGLDNAYASFNITPNGYSGKENSKFALASSSYDGVVSVCYRFISGSSATYGGLAAMCREQLVREGVLSTRTVSSENDMPLNVTLIGCIKKGFGATSSYTTFENAEDIAGVLKAKGINALNLRFDGAFSGGLRQKNVGSAKFDSKLGSNKDYESLKNYLGTQGFNLYFTLNILTSNSGGKKAAGVLDKNVHVSVKSGMEKYIGVSEFEFKGLASENLTSNIVSFMNKMKDHDVAGYCLDDAGSVLFSDFSGSFSSRQNLSEDIFSQSIALSTNKRLMVENGNLYTLKNALVISDIPMEVSYKESASYNSVPFVQMILHGTIEYTGGYLNMVSDYNKLLLRSIEYGAMPAFEWVYSDFIPDGEEKSAMFYDNWTGEALEVYNTFNSIFNGLRDAKMTSHDKIQEGLYCTEYNNETFIYVNYTDKDITYNNLTIKAGSYLRVN